MEVLRPSNHHQGNKTYIPRHARRKDKMKRKQQGIDSMLANRETRKEESAERWAEYEMLFTPGVLEESLYNQRREQDTLSEVRVIRRQMERHPIPHENVPVPVEPLATDKEMEQLKKAWGI